ncbi:MAG: phenylacetate--CoA ligase family protein [Polyangiaceae bacterium]|nr:phenylacetate--CoA ligase family protein [Polyangiaceae bacterium]MCW5790233.1 phenylacetate--CoA ligase family protein [Polyangiaceae bacterium]
MMGRGELAMLARVAAQGPGKMAQGLLRRTERLAPEALGALQLMRASELVQHAVAKVPYYREHFPQDLPQRFDMATWRALPLLTREAVREERAALQSSAPPLGHLGQGEAHSSGSTGRHVTVSQDRAALGVNSALSERGHAWHGRDTRLRCAVIRAEIDGMRRPGLSWGAGGGGLHLLDIHTPVREQLEWLLERAPDYLSTYATNASALIEEAARAGVRWPGLRQVMTFGEVLAPEARARCLEVWGVPLVDGYSSVELGHLAQECPLHSLSVPDGSLAPHVTAPSESAHRAPVDSARSQIAPLSATPRYHVAAEQVLFEVLREDGSACAPGETGRVVVTSLHNFVMPLIRYELGDYATLGEPCECGRGLPVLTRVDGRARGLLRLRSGDVLWPRFASNILGRELPIRQFRMVQTGYVEFRLELVSVPLTDRQVARLRSLVLSVLKRHLGEEPQLELAYRTSIPRSAGGKFEDFISEVAEPRAARPKPRTPG